MGVNLSQEEIDYLTENMEDILEENNQSPDLIKAFNQITNLEKNKSMVAYHAKEAPLNIINEIIFRNKITDARNNEENELNCSECYLTRFPASVLNDNEHLKKQCLQKTTN
ncbi:MAG: hypothetical protein JSS07_07515 [Proteobacteria bacterium]|nr:hypothetical protein [Pseudomonadota bacterium]